MKVSVITMHNYPNYGSVLQAFATQEKLKEYADDVEIIDYSGGVGTVGRSIPKYLSIGFGANPVKACLKLPVRIRQRSVYGGFAKRYLNITAERYSSDEDLAGYPIHDGFYCTGSDQVWNPFFAENMPFFLNFVPAGRKKFAYAASLGNYREEWFSPEQVERTGKYIEQYEYVSIREERGLKILREQFDCRNAVQLVDPTLAMPPEFWRNLAPESRIKGEYILLYKLGKEKYFETFAEEVSARTGLPLVRLCSQSFHQLLYRAKKRVILPQVFRFITLIDNAKYLITDSFHGVALSMNMNTEPIVYREEYDGDRIYGFLRMLGQEDRYVRSCGGFEILDRRVDFDRVNTVLDRERKRVDEFLSRVFREVQEV